MPGYEMSIIMKALQRPALTQVLKRTCESIMTKGGIITKMENLGTKTLPYRMSKHGEKYFTGNYFIFNFQSPSAVVEDLNEELNRDVDVIRPAFLNRDVERFEKPCEKGPCIWGEIKHPMHEKIIGKRKYWRRY
ncbi:small ribosomal subunit protein bS6m-like [Lineus longissimus]|uniref:small ribosomal subunit protein bS6m-like n=1 Tax=Lineus longissimus TaxID=88925 RepID=UPI002B4CEEA9